MVRMGVQREKGKGKGTREGRRAVEEGDIREGGEGW